MMWMYFSDYIFLTKVLRVEKHKDSFFNEHSRSLFRVEEERVKENEASFLL